MKYHLSSFSLKFLVRDLLLTSTALLVLISMVGCTLLSEESNSSENDSVRETQIALAVQQTRLAEQEAEATRLAGQAPSQPVVEQPSDGGAVTPDTAGTQAALQATQSAIETSAAQPPVVDTPAEPPPPTPTLENQPPPADFREMMKSASILVYEDMANDPSEYFYVRRTLDYMGLNYKWDGSAKGSFKTDLLGGSPAGGPWDLVIVAVEYRSGIQGEFFDYLADVLNQGTSIIMEAWHLDGISAGTVSNILARCGVQVYEYFPKTGTANDVVVWPISGATGHPIMSEPNSGLSFTKARTKWLLSGDLGDLMALTGSGDAQFLMSTDATKKDRDAVLATCMQGQLTLQTFSSHSFGYEVSSPLWENMITNALRVRLLGSQ
jgi:hypothetical protein